MGNHLSCDMHKMSTDTVKDGRISVDTPFVEFHQIDVLERIRPRHWSGDDSAEKYRFPHLIHLGVVTDVDADIDDENITS